MLKFMDSDGWEIYVSRTKSAKIFASKTSNLESVDSWESVFYVSSTKSAKIFRLKWPKARINERF
jgi:hypothetical protein